MVVGRIVCFLFGENLLLIIFEAHILLHCPTHLHSILCSAYIKFYSNRPTILSINDFSLIFEYVIKVLPG